MKKRGVILVLGIFVISSLIVAFNSFNVSNPIINPGETENKYAQNIIPKASDSFEPNNNSGSAALISEGFHSNLNLSDDLDEDWFRIYMDPGKYLIVNIYFSTSNGDINLELYNISISLLAGSYSATDNELITYKVNNPGDYFIRIFNETNSYYDLEVIIDDEFEPNNDFSSAAEISPSGYSSLKCNDDDWFRVWIDSGNHFKFEIHFDNLSGNLDLQLYDNNPTPNFLTGSYSMDDYEAVSWTAGYSGYYYIRIFNYGDFNNYDMNVYFIYDKYEPNDEDWDAIEIYKGYHRHLWCRDDDWYKVWINSGEQLSVDIFFNNDSGNLDLQLYNNNPTPSLLTGSYTPDDDEKISWSTGYSGYYLIKVYYVTYENSYNMKIGGQPEIIFEEDFEGLLSPKLIGFGGDNYWHVTSNDSSPTSPSHSAWCGNESTGTYNKRSNGKDISYKDSITLTGLDLRDYCFAELSMDYIFTSITSSADNMGFSVRVLGEQFYLNPKNTDNVFEVGRSFDKTTGWVNFTYDISFLCGFSHVDIIFYFEADDSDNNYKGLMVDNILITGIKDEKLWGNTLNIEKEDEYYYHISYIDHEAWSRIFGRELPWYPSYIKLEIFGIYDRGLYWDVVVRFWDSTDDFEELHGTEEITYKVYKNPLNMKDGANFFIPSNEIWRYLDRADNYDWYNNYDIHHLGDPRWNEYNIEFCYDDFRVHLRYSENGLLMGMNIHENDGNKVFEMWRTDYGKEDGEEDEGEKDAIPGYDIPIVVILVSIVSIIYAIKIKKSRNK